MCDVIFNRYLFLRTPALSYKDYHISVLENLLKKQFFKSAIFFASESLYMELERSGFNYHLLDNKVKLGLQKYFNRMCHRPTPFGMFSAFSSLNWGLSENSQSCVVEDGGEIYVNPDFQFTVDMARMMEKSGEFSNVKYYLNSTIYTIKGEKRYLAQRFDGKRKKTDFFINSFESNRLLSKLLNYCKDGKTKAELINWLCDFVKDKDEVKDYVNDLIEEGLLIPELFPNMAGEKYFDRIVNIATGQENNSELAGEILSYQNLLAEIMQDGNLNVEKLVENDLYVMAKKKFKSMFYVGYEKKTKSTMNKKYQEYIKDGLYCLNKITTEATTKSLNNFKGKFKARFEDQEIPVLHALDREAGIGYEGLETNLVTSELLDGIQLDLQLSSLNFNWTPVHEFFLSKLVEINGDEPIIIFDEDLDKLKVPSELKMPPSFSVVFRLCGDKILIEQAGGCTATALLGRFSLFSEKVLEEARYITSVEERSNEDVIFAEISCFNDEHAANINSNAGIRNYEIPIGVHSTFNKNNIISLSDLTISVIDNHIILRSKKLNKTIIPRLSSAFNYSRSELTIFRFLCDLQYQGLKFNYNFDLRALLPGLNYYPRVEYKNCILFPATWILSAIEIAEITALAASRRNFYKMCKKNRLERRFALTEGDNQLLFDQEDAASIDLFLQVIKNKAMVILQEVFIDQPSDVINRSGQPFVGQFIASVFADGVTYPQKTLAQVGRKKNKVKRIYLPGDEWVYFKLYCHPASSNNILVKDVKNIIALLKKQNIVKSWFYIRYADPDNHLRIRIKINPDDAANVVRYFEKKMRGQVERGCVNNLLLDTYKREIERYGEDTIEYAEEIFYVSSELIINYLKNIKVRQTDFSEWHLAIISVDALLGIFFPENSDRIDLLKLMHEGMKHEFDDSKQVKLQLDNKYREYSGFFNNMNKSKPAITLLAGKKEFECYTKALLQLRSNIQCATPGKCLKLAGDLIHMHLNRLFNDKQRNHEFIIYYLLYKYYLSAEARKGKGLLSFSPTFKGLSINHVNEDVLK